MNVNGIKTFSSLKLGLKPKNGNIFYSKFGVKFHVKNNQIWICRDYGPLKLEVLLENDADFFFDWIKTKEKNDFHTSEIPFEPTKEDWKIIRKEFRTFFLSITSHCNSNCNICYKKPDFSDYLTLEDIGRFLKKVGKNKNIQLYGGEPTTRKDLFKIIKLIRKSGNFPLIYTNGLKLADLNYVKKLKKNGIEKVNFSFDGFREDIYENLRGNKKQLFIKLKALNNLEKIGIDVWLSSTIVKDVNEDEVPRLLKFAINKNHFIKGLYLIGAVPHGRFNVEIKKFLTPSDFIEILNRKIRKDYIIEFEKLKFNMNSFFKKIGFCFPGYFGGILFRVEDKKIREFIPLKKLKKINKCIETGKYLYAFTNLLKYIRVFSFLKRLVKFPRLKFESLGDNLLNIVIINICPPFYYLPVKRDTSDFLQFDNKIMIWPVG